MVSERIIGPMGQLTKEDGNEIRLTVAAYTIGQMVVSMKDLGRAINYMGRESTVGLMVDCIQANILTIKSTVSVFMSGLMAKSTKATGRMD